MYNRGRLFGSLPQVTRSLLIINIIVFVVAALLQRVTLLPYYLRLYNFQSELFRPYQLVTHMFMHGDIFHIFVNMFGLFMFGRVLENVWGSRKFFILYMTAGLGAAFLQLGINYLSLDVLQNSLEAFHQSPSPELYWKIVQKYQYAVSNEAKFIAEKWFENPGSNQLFQQAWSELTMMKTRIVNIPMVGASGALMGIVASFAILFPNVELMVIPIPIPIKAKYLIGGFILFDLAYGFINFSGGSNIAHFAHLGGALVGFILVKIWNKNRFKMY
ncbi:MAG: rhomboid family intramembrane serine protease [Bacteroidales bacterium]